jgi:hypothetical protein
MVILFILSILRSCFAKRVTETASAPPKKPFMKPKQKKNDFTAEVKPCQTGPGRSWGQNSTFNHV